MSVDDSPGFVDTNVLVYAFEKGDTPKRALARQLLSDLMAHDRLRLSTQVLQELYVTLTRKVRQPCSPEEALEILDHLAEWPTATLDYTAVRSAAILASRTKISYWDALVAIAAASLDAPVLYTEDLNDGQEILGVRIRNPFRTMPGEAVHQAPHTLTLRRYS